MAGQGGGAASAMHRRSRPPCRTADWLADRHHGWPRDGPLPRRKSALAPLALPQGPS